MPLDLFNYQIEAEIPRFTFSTSFPQDVSCYKSGPQFQPLEIWESNNNVDTMLVINIFIEIFDYYHFQF